MISLVNKYYNTIVLLSSVCNLINHAILSGFFFMFDFEQSRSYLIILNNYYFIKKMCHCNTIIVNVRIVEQSIIKTVSISID